MRLCFYFLWVYAIMKEFFLLDPDIVYLNHGSFGATPQPVFVAYQDWQRRLENQPVRFLVDELPVLLQDARRILGAYLNASLDDLVFIANATFGVNVIARSLHLSAGDEVLATNHEYGACDRTWEYLCQQSGARYIRQHISLPVSGEDRIVDDIWRGVTPRTRMIALSHISSPTAITLPVEAICSRARREGILTMIDGAHAPGQIPVDLGAIGADFYTGNCHKWMLAPKGSAFLYARPEAQVLIQPLVVSWGWQPEPWFTTGSPFIDSLQWLGTRDPSAFLAVPDAIRFMAEHDWLSVSRDCHALLEQAVQRVSELTGLRSIYPDGSDSYHQMAALPLPPIADIRAFKKMLYDMYEIEVPCYEWQGMPLTRISVQAYNTQADIDYLVDTLRETLGTHKRV